MTTSNLEKTKTKFLLNLIYSSPKFSHNLHVHVHVHVH